MKNLSFWLVVVCIGLLVALGFSLNNLKKVKAESSKYKSNTETLLSEVERYKIQDSLSAARVSSLEFTMKEFERFRAEDAALISELKRKNRDLSDISKAQSETIIALRAVPKDTVIITRDSIVTPAVSVHCGDVWFDFEGYLTDKEFSGTLINRDSLVLAETVKYRRFLGFLWKTRRVDERTLQAVSKNPHTTILNLEHILIEN